MLVGTGSEVHVCVEAAARLAADGIAARVVSLPSLGPASRPRPTPTATRSCPPGCPTLAVEAGVTFGWDRYADDTRRHRPLRRLGAGRGGPATSRLHRRQRRRTAARRRSLGRHCRSDVRAPWDRAATTSTTQQGQIALARQPAARLPALGRAPGATSTAASGASRPTRRSSRRRSPTATTTTSSSARSSAGGSTRSTTPTGAWSPTTSARPSTLLRPVYDASRRHRRLRLGRGRSRPGPRHRRHHRLGPRTCTSASTTQPAGQDPGHGRGRPRHPHDDRRGPQHQRHAHLLPRPLRRGHGGLPRRPRGLPRRRPRRPVGGAQRGLVLHLAGSTPRSTTASTAIGDRRGPRPAGPGRRRPGQAGLPAVPRDASPAPAGRRSRAAGARVQRPLWASTSTKNPDYPDTLYVDTLIGPDTVNTLPDGHPRRLRGPRHGGAHHRRRRRRRPRRCSTGSPRSASTWTTSPGCSRTRAWPRSRSPSTSCSRPCRPKADHRAI